MIINFVGNFQKGYVGEQADQVHLAREMEALGHTVQRVPQDIWKAFCDGERNLDWVAKLPNPNADIAIITKWHHFDNEKYIRMLQEISPTFYWVWDYMDYNGIPDWHKNMVRACDLYLTNEYGMSNKYKNLLLEKAYYFPFDVADGSIPVYDVGYKYDVVFFGSYLDQGHRIEWLKEINKTNPITIFAWNFQDWQKEGFSAKPAVYGEEFNKTVSSTKICLGFSVEPDCWGYWSNRVGKILSAGGFLLYEYAPGMELFLRDGVEYFSSIKEAQEKIDHYLIADYERQQIAKRGYEIGRDAFTSKARVKELMILCERYLKGHDGWKY